MQKSLERVNPFIEKQVVAALTQALADTRDPEEIKTILNDLLGDVEQTAVANRLAIAVFLDKGRSYENIRKTLKVSSATIAKVAQHMGNPGIRLALRKVKAEEWAEKWSKRLKRLLQ